MTPGLRLPAALLGVLAVAALAACAGATPTAEPTPTPSPTPAPETPGVSDDAILFGQSVALTGPTRELGSNVERGVRAAFDKQNAEGGVHGRRVDLYTLDDGYEPNRAIENTNTLINNNVFALIGYVGTPTSRAAIPIAHEHGVPFMAPFTGASSLRDSEWTNVVNMRASYRQEVAAMVDGLINQRGAERIAVMYQNDSYGRDGWEAVDAALANYARNPVAIGTYPRNSTAVKSGVLNLLKGDPDAVILIGAYEPVAQTIMWATQVGIDATFLTVSFVGSDSLAAELDPTGTPIFVTQVVPTPSDTGVPVVASYLRALREYEHGAVPNHTSLEGYMIGRLVLRAAEICGRDIDRACFVDGLKALGDFDIDGFPLSYNDAEWDNQGSDQVYVTAYSPDGDFIPVNDFRYTPPAPDAGEDASGDGGGEEGGA